MSHADVLVVGAGPAGCSAALTLARAGVTVRLLEKAAFPRDKCCGDGLTAGALRQLEALGLDPGRVRSWRPVREVAVRSPSSRTVDLELPADGQHTAVARRVDLDDALAELTRHQPGVDLREEAGLDRISCGHDGIEAWSSDGACHRARYLVAADGAWSPTRRALGGLGDTGTASWRRTGEWHAMRQYFSNVPDAAQRLWVWFEPELLPAYAWSFPLNHGVVNVGLGIIHGHGLRPAQMGPVWRGLLERPHVRRVLGDQLKAEGPMKAWPIPTSVDPALWSGGDGRVLFVGDAARLGDPMTGEGIGQALESGRLAAEAVVAAGSDHPPAAAERYRSAVAACIGSDNRLASGLTRVLSRPWAARAGLAAIGMNRWTRSHFARWMFEDYPRAILATPARWQKGVFSPPGAYRLGQ